MTTQPGAALLAVLRRLDETEWLPPAELEALQFRALTSILRHACETVPYYRERPVYRRLLDGGPLDAGAWRQVPVLTRAEVQDAEDDILSQSVPADHLPLGRSLTSGSTGRPVRVVGTGATRRMTRALGLREHVWQGRDSTGSLAIIRFDYGKIPREGVVHPAWGPAINCIFPKGPCAILGHSHPVAYQAEWLLEQNPHYLRAQPSLAVPLARELLARGARLERLRDVATFGETLSPEARDACRRAWGVEIADIYGNWELGILALQCPDGEGLHVQSENVLLEVLDDAGEQCRPGEVGRVFGTSLHNWAMPLLRYEVGDLAEVGDACRCGRGLPLLTRVLGRTKNVLVLPTGERVLPIIPARIWAGTAPIRRLQLVQDEIDHIEALMVTARPLTADEEEAFTAAVRRLLKYPFRVTLTDLGGDDRFATSGPKFEEFVSRL